VRIVWTATAYTNIDDIENHIARDNLKAAFDVRNQIDTHINLLEDQPRMGRKGRVSDTRELVVTGLPYVVVYRVRKSVVEIVRVLHGAQQWPR